MTQPINLPGLKEVIVITFLVLISCTQQVQHPRSVERTPDPAERMIAEAVVSVVHEIQSPAMPDFDLDQATAHDLTVSTTIQADQQTYDSSLKPATIQWNGPLEPLLTLISQYYGLEFIITGERPHTPILVNISLANQELSTIIDHINALKPLQARIQYSAVNKTVELIYVSKP